MLAPIAAHSMALDTEIGMLENDIKKLRTEQARLVSELEKCDPQKAKNLAIAGGVLTGVAVGGVIGAGVQAGQIKKLDAKIEEADKKLAAQKEADRKAGKVAAVTEAKEEAAKKECDDKKGTFANGTCTLSLDESEQQIENKNNESDVLKENQKSEPETKSEGVSSKDQNGGLLCPVTSNYPGASGKGLGDSCSYAAGTYFSEARGGVSAGNIRKAGNDCYCHATACSDSANYELKSGKCLRKNSVVALTSGTTQTSNTVTTAQNTISNTLQKTAAPTQISDTTSTQWVDEDAIKYSKERCGEEAKFIGLSCVCDDKSKMFNSILKECEEGIRLDPSKLAIPKTTTPQFHPSQVQQHVMVAESTRVDSTSQIRLAVNYNCTAVATIGAPGTLLRARCDCEGVLGKKSTEFNNMNACNSGCSSFCGRS